MKSRKKTRLLLGLLLTPLLLSGCFDTENQLKKEATLEALVSDVGDHPKKRLLVADTTKDNKNSNCARYDSENLILPLLKMVQFTPLTEEDKGPMIHSRNLVAFSADRKHAFMLSDDLINIEFAYDNGLSWSEQKIYSNYRKVKKEDGIRIHDTIKEAYRKGEPERSSSCKLREETSAD